jgi:Tol biopolymer transport system component/DNA-binding winged helix-turn-helix (wHTH) protein
LTEFAASEGIVQRLAPESPKRDTKNLQKISEGRMEQKRQHFYQFGPFVLDTVQHALLRENQPVPLTPKTYDTLLVLVENRGRMLTKDELMKALWPDSFVEESNLSVQISAIRKWLGELPGEDRYIVTIPGRGYRFSAEVRGWSQDDVRLIPEDHRPAEAVTAKTAEQGARESKPPADAVIPLPVPSTGGETPAKPFRFARLALVIAAAGVALLAGFLFIALRSPLPPPRIQQYMQLTTSGHVNPSSVILTDGTRVYFVASPSGGPDVSLNQVPSEGGEAAEIPLALKGFALCAISPDHSRLLLLGSPEKPFHHSLWSASVLGGSPRRLGNIEAFDAQWTPDGQRILYSAGTETYLADADGGNPRKLMTTPGAAGNFHWSPSGRYLRFTMTDLTSSLHSVWEASADGSNTHPVLPGWNHGAESSAGEWTPDGKYYLFQSVRDGKSSIWAIREKRDLLHKYTRDPVLLTAGPLDLSQPTLSPDGGRLFVVSLQNRGDLMRYDPKPSGFVPYLPGLSAHRLSFTKDGQWVAYTTYPEGDLWRSRTDGSDRLRLTFPPLHAELPRFSPDGSQIVFTASDSVRPGNLYLISAGGGEPQRLLPQGGDGGDPDWSPDGGSVVFGPNPAFVQGPAAAAGNAGIKSIRVLDLKTRKVSELPDSGGLYWPRWAAGGDYIVCLSLDTHKLMLFDIKLKKWTELAHGEILHNPLWSREGKTVYFQDLGATGQPIYRVAIATRRVDRVVGSEAIRRADIMYSAFTGLTPDDAPVSMLIHGLYDIYALNLDLR